MLALVFAVIAATAMFVASIVLFVKRYPQFGILFLAGALFIGLTLRGVTYGWQTGFWLLWFVVLAIMVAPRVTASIGSLAGVFVFVIVVMTSFASTNTAPADSQTTMAINVDGEQMYYKVSHAAQTEPLVGAVTTGELDTLPSLNDGKDGPCSWTDLVDRVNALHQVQKDIYVNAVNQRAQYLGDWNAVMDYAQIEKEMARQGRPLDTRVILIINDDATEKQARSALHPSLGEAANTLPIVRTSGAIINTRSGAGDSHISNFGDGRKQIRVLLTVPLWNGSKYTANVPMAEKATGVLCECTNLSTGVVKNPKPTPVPVTRPPSPTTSTTTPPVTTTTTPPKTTTTTTTPPKSTTTTPPTSTTTTTTTTPPSTTSTTPPSTTTTTPPVTTTTTPPKGPVPYPTTKPPVQSPPGPTESTAPVETNPANPTTRPGDEAPGVPAPGVTQEPSTPKPTPVPTVAPDPSDPGTPIPDPDSRPSPAPSSAMGLVGIGLLPWILRERKRRLRQGGIKA